MSKCQWKVKVFLLNAKSWLIGKDSDAGRDWGQEEKGTTEGDGWMASPTQWTWVWVNSGRWWWTGRPGMLQFMGSQRVGHDWATELNWFVKCQWLLQNCWRRQQLLPLVCKRGKMMMNTVQKWNFNCLRQDILFPIASISILK